MQLKIHEAAALTGVTVRTLHYYDKIGLLKPAQVAENGYRVYGRGELMRLQQILFYRELDFPLEQIRRLLDSPSFDRQRALCAQHELLLKKKERLERIIELAERTMKGEVEMSFQEFDNHEFTACREKYQKEAEERWGDTEAFEEYRKKAAGYGKKQWAAITEEGNEIIRAFAAKSGLPAEEAEVQALVAEWQEHISRNYYHCTDEILAGLGSMYAADERFRNYLDRFGEGTAELMSGAIAVYVKKK